MSLSTEQLLKIAVFGNAEYFPDYMAELDDRPAWQIEETYSDIDSFYDDWYADLKKQHMVREKDVTQCSDQVLINSIMGRTSYIAGSFEEFARRKGVEIRDPYGYRPPYMLDVLAEVAVLLGF